jgi:diphthamide biosynthesis protein 2
VTRITQHNFKRIVCQFPDHYLHCCTEVYLHLATRVPPECDIFIAADSTFGSSVDDISAAHVEADLLIFFGSDLSGSGSVNVMIIPPIKTIDIKRCVDAVATIITTPLDSPSLLVIDPCYLHEREALLTALQQLLPNLEPGQLPSCLGLPGIWAPASSPAPAMLKGSPAEQVGGVYFSTADVSSAENVIYIGEKEEQLATLFLRLSQQRVLRYSPLEDSDADGLPTVEVFQGDTTRVFRERYGGVSKVKDAKIVGLLVGSMGIETLNLQTIVKQLQLLVEAAGKKFYVFVLGRINEAKLCNFPEVCNCLFLLGLFLFG